MLSQKSVYRLILSLYTLALFPVGVFAQSAGEIHAYHRGWQTAERLMQSETLSASEIEQALQGFEARLKRQQSAYEKQQIQAAIEQYREAQQEQNEQLSLENQAKGADYLAHLEKQGDYLMLDEGLAYRIVQEGDGAMPQSGTQVQLNYVARHIDGTEFDRSDGARWYPLQSVLPGWRLALRRMPVGSRWTVVVPPQLAYRESGLNNRVGPNETLVFDIKLSGIR